MTEASNTPTARAAIYARTATEQFKPGSLERQVRRCRKAIAEQLPGCVVADDCVFQDYGVSGVKASRPGLDALLKRAAESPRPFDSLVVETTNRIGRSLSVVFNVLDTLKYYGADVYIVDAGMGSVHPAFRAVNIAHPED